MRLVASKEINWLIFSLSLNLVQFERSGMEWLNSVGLSFILSFRFELELVFELNAS